MVKSIFSLWALFLLFSARQAQACASCGFNDGTNNYFLVMILFMTALPVTCVGLGIYFVRKKALEQDRNRMGIANASDEQ